MTDTPEQPAEISRVQPALTPEEWAWCGRLPDLLAAKDIAVVALQPVLANGAHRPHALAALCLYGTPEGFTQKDVWLCVGLAKWLVNGAFNAELRAAGIGSFNSEPARALEKLAARLQALLPPKSLP